MFLSDQVVISCDRWLRQVYDEYTIIFLFLHLFKGDNWHIFLFETTTTKNLEHWLFLGTIKASSFKICMIITLLGVCNFIVGLLTVPRSQVCQKYELQIACFVILVLCSFNVMWLLHTSKRLGTIWLVCSGVYPREIINMFSSVKCHGSLKTLTLGFTRTPKTW